MSHHIDIPLAFVVAAFTGMLATHPGVADEFRVGVSCFIGAVLGGGVASAFDSVFRERYSRGALSIKWAGSSAIAVFSSPAVTPTLTTKMFGAVHQVTVWDYLF